MFDLFSVKPFLLVAGSDLENACTWPPFVFYEIFDLLIFIISGFTFIATGELVLVTFLKNLEVVDAANDLCDI